MSRSWILVFIACAIFGMDIWLKAFTNAHIPVMSAFFPSFPYGGIAVFHDWFGIDFSINHITNHGAAWGAFRKYSELLLGLRIAMIVGMAVYLAFYNKKPEHKLPLTLILTGACANVLDYFLYGHVVDMFHFNFWGHSFAIFNIADAAICCGVCLLLLNPWLMKAKQRIQNLKKLP